MTGTPLRRRLFALAVAGILPLAVMAGIGLYALERQQSAQAERVGLELARSVGNAVDAELRNSIATLEALATTPTLDAGDPAAFRDRAERVVVARPDWVAVVLADATGTPLVDTRSLAEARLPPIGDRESLDRAIDIDGPVVGSLIRYADTGWIFAVRVPVHRDGRLRYVVSALVRPGAIRRVLTRQQVPGDWVISIVDSHGLRVARSRAHAANLGGRLSESVQRVVDRGEAEGFGVAYTLEGQRIFTPYSRLASCGWIAVIGIPTAMVDAAGLRSLEVYGSGILLSILLGTLGALWVARTITRPIADLRAAAEALGRRQVPRPPATTIQEIREVGAALRTARDELAQAEADREDLLSRERRARAAAEMADRAKDEFMAVLSHELRTPLNAVYGWARLLQGGQVTDPAMIARATEAIVRNADVQVRLVDDLLDVSRITSGKMRLDVRRVDLPPVLRAALDAVRPAAEARNIRVHSQLDPTAGPVAGDPARLQQVVWNLLMNAVKFTPTGGRVQLTLQRAATDVEITVSDTGQGIASEMLPHIFEPFRQADSSSTRIHGGLGLGLALVKHLVQLQGGTVAAHSAGEGLGAAFTVTLPVLVAEVPAGTTGHETVAAGPVEAHTRLVPLDGRRVAVVDDDAEGLVVAAAILARAGADVRTCTSAPEALALLQQWRPDVLVSDIEMPGEDGYALIRKVRALPQDAGGRTPAVALTAYGRPQDRPLALAAGYNMHVPKPVDPGELTAIVAGLAGGESGLSPWTIAISGERREPLDV